MYNIVYFCIVAFLVEYVTEVVRRKEVFSPIRDFLYTLPPPVGLFFAKLFSCGFCVAFWVSLLITTIALFCTPLPSIIGEDLLNFLTCTVLSAGLSNNWHGFKDRYLETYKDNRYNPVVLILSQSNEEIEKNEHQN